MNKIKMSAGSQRILRSQRSAGLASTADSAPVVAPKLDGTVPIETYPLPVSPINVRQMAEDAAKIRSHIANGRKPDKLSEIKFFRPRGLSDR